MLLLPVRYRDLIYGVVGIIMCTLAGTIYSNIGVIPPEFLNLSLSPDDNSNTPVGILLSSADEATDNLDGGILGEQSPNGKVAGSGDASARVSTSDDQGGDSIPVSGEKCAS